MNRLQPFRLVTGAALAALVFTGGACLAASPDSSLTPQATQPAPPTTAPAADALKAFEYVTMSTSKGDIVILLDTPAAPRTVANFLKYVDDDYYAGTIFHRVISSFMIQGGGFATDGTKKETREGVLNEWKNGLKNVRGSLSMARLGRQPHSGTSQFFINVVDNAVLDSPRDGAAYAVFGTVIDGMDVVDAIRDTPTGNADLAGRPMRDVPQETIEITGVSRTKLSALSDAAKKHAMTWSTDHAAARAGVAAEQKRYEAAAAALEAGKQTTDSGLSYAVVEDGDGLRPTASDSVTVVYTGWFPGGYKFDSSLDHPSGPTASFPLSRVIRGWTEGVALMPVGATYVFEIPATLGYGVNGTTGIPANQTLIFQVELKSID